MPPIRFRVKTIMIVIAALAVVMGRLRFRTRARFYFDSIVTLPIVAILLVIIIFLGAVIVELIASEIRPWCDRVRRWQLARKANGRFRRSEPNRSGEPERV